MSQAAPRLRVRSTSYVVIPARLASTRLPRKLLLAETGKPMVQHTYEAAMLAERPVGLCVAADHEEIAAAVRSFGGDVRMTSPDCASGTDRVAEIARHLDDVDILVNVQGDEPELAASSIDRVIELLEENPQMVMSTLATPIRSRAARRPGLRQGGVRRPRPGDLFQPQPDSARAAMERRPATVRSADFLSARRFVRVPSRLLAAAG